MPSLFEGRLWAEAADGLKEFGMEVFDYNRENYMHDTEMRFDRFSDARNFMIDQVNQYREDLRGLTELTAGKCDTIYVVSTLFMCIAGAASCAGRIGLHGAAPPGYFSALYTGHICTAVLYLTVSMWLALHATQRAQCGMVSLLTRKVRLPIPCLDEIDQARNFGSAYEKQRWGDIFRVPFTPHPEAAPVGLEELYDDEADRKRSKKGKKDKKGEKEEWKVDMDDSRGFGSTKRSSVPSWIRDEVVQDRGGGSSGGRTAKRAHDIPEHFKLFANAQLEWYPYEVYARVMMLYGVLQFLNAILYFTVGHAVCELREFWLLWAIPLPFLSVQALILRLDILKAEGQQLLPHLEWAGHIAPYTAVMALTLDYRKVYSDAGVKVVWLFVFLAYLGHVLFTVRLLDLAWPYKNRETDMEDQPGRGWWPATWRLPPAFSQMLWVIAPPAKLEPGQHDMMNEMEALAHTGGGITSTVRQRKGRECKPGQKPARPVVELRRQAKRLDAQLDWWFQDMVYSQVCEAEQRHLDELKFEIGRLKQQVKQLESASRGINAANKADVEKQSGILGFELDKVEDGLQKVEANNEVAGDERTGLEGAYTGKSMFTEDTPFNASGKPWLIVKIALGTVVFVWVFVMIGTIVEIALGKDAILKPPGQPPWIRDNKNRHIESTIHLSSHGELPNEYRLLNPVEANYDCYDTEEEFLDWHRPLFSNEEVGTVGTEGTKPGPALGRRLMKRSKKKSSAMKQLAKILPTLGWLAAEIGSSARTPLAPLAAKEPLRPDGPPRAQRPPSEGGGGHALRAVPAAWPALFEPAYLACGTASSGDKSIVVLALSPRGSGAIFMLGQGRAHDLRRFALEGAADFGALVAAAWAPALGGVAVVTREGRLLRCPRGLDDPWVCQEEADALPLPRGSKLSAAALTDHVDAGGVRVRLAAALLEGSLQAISIYRANDSQPWTKIAQVTGASSGRIALSFDGADLLITSAQRIVHRLNLQDELLSVRQAHNFEESTPMSDREWKAICVVPSTSASRSDNESVKAFLHLALRRSEDENGTAWLPELFASS